MLSFLRDCSVSHGGETWGGHLAVEEVMGWGHPESQCLKYQALPQVVHPWSILQAPVISCRLSFPLISSITFLSAHNFFVF